MAVQLHNVRTRQKEAFAPLQPDRVGMYVCGLTVYDHMHIGHARTAVSFEVIRRWLEHRHGAVHFVQNVTDVDDKIIARAAQLGVSPRVHAATWDAECQQQSDRLGVRPPDEAPHATTSMDGIIQFIEGILDQGFAYETDAGNVYFDVPKYDDHAAEAHPECGYGSLSGRDYRQMAAGTRKEVESDKRHPADFALWKAAKGDEPEDARWDSPWGSGRPGWHIECSYMSTAALGDQFDIHGGGQDLIFPHHENEVAQSQAKTGKAPFVHTWLHTGFLNVEGQKMSKSLGNYITLKDTLDELEAEGTDPAALRFYFVQTHYRSKIDYSRKGLEEAKGAVARLERTRRNLASVSGLQRIGCADIDPGLRTASQALHDAFTAAMDDDIHTPGAIAALFDFNRQANKALDAGELGSDAAAEALEALEWAGQVLTLFDRPFGGAAVPDDVLQLAASLSIAADDEGPLLNAILAAREEARGARDFATADRIRDTLAAAGYVIEDTPNGARWTRA